MFQTFNSSVAPKQPVQPVQSRYTTTVNLYFWIPPTFTHFHVISPPNKWEACEEFTFAVMKMLSNKRIRSMLFIGLNFDQMSNINNFSAKKSGFERSLLTKL